MAKQPIELKPAAEPPPCIVICRSSGKGIGILLSLHAAEKAGPPATLVAMIKAVVEEVTKMTDLEVRGLKDCPLCKPNVALVVSDPIALPVVNVVAQVVQAPPSGPVQ